MVSHMFRDYQQVLVLKYLYLLKYIFSLEMYTLRDYQLLSQNQQLQGNFIECLKWNQKMIDLCEVAIEPFGPTATGLQYDDCRVKYHSFKCNTTNYLSAPKYAVGVMQPPTP